VAWITGGGSGIGAAAAAALAREGAAVILTGRREAAVKEAAAAIEDAGGTAYAQPGDVTSVATVHQIVDWIRERFGQLDILVNNAGANIVERDWGHLTPEGVDEVILANLSSAYYCAIAVLPIMRAQRSGGVLIHTASLAGLIISRLPGSAYTAAKHGLVAMSHSINVEECIHNIRSCAICPGEVATPILDKRPVPVSAEDRARMVQSEDVGDLIRYIACLPPHVCINEVTITPTYNRAYVAAMTRHGE
jgi:NAD(P)-dependent dehydrogenase (short-subunit alcohol dehydrogenase family)